VNARRLAWIRGLFVAALAVGYAVLAHLSNSRPNAHALGVLLAVGPLVIMVCGYLWRRGARVPALLVVALAAVVVARFWPMLAEHFPWLYMLQQAGAYGFLGFVFGRSLAAGRVPLCTHWATMVHGSLPSEALRYTRRVTEAWTLFFALMTGALIGLFLLAPLPVWSVFANFCGLPLVVAMFVGEYLARGRALPDMERASIFDGVRAFLGSALS
jgi:uncharacterized membrane protein